MSNFSENVHSMKHFCHEKGVSDEKIKQAEQALEVEFSLEYRECLKLYGAISCEGHELTGFSADEALDVVRTTRENWKKYRNVEKKLYVIEEAHIDGIVIWQSASGEVYQTAPNLPPQKIADSLCEYLSD